MSSLLARVHPRRLVSFARSGRASGFARRLLHFWFVWSALLLVHEGGHALVARRQGLRVERVSIGVGPVLWSDRIDGTPVMLRLVPLAGLTTLDHSSGTNVDGTRADEPAHWQVWRAEMATLGGGVLATFLLASVIAGCVAARERVSRKTWRWGRFIVADAVVLTVFNFLPIPPLDGGRAVLGAFAAWHGSPLAGSALFWVQAGGFVLAVVPMTLWTRWTARIDAAALRWGAPKPPTDS
jgi:membrane-associated protease RseP (regulator of RpoE activity)